MIQKGTSNSICACSTEAVNGKKKDDIDLCEILHESLFTLINYRWRTVLSLHLSALNLDQLSVVFPLANPVPFHLGVPFLALQQMRRERKTSVNIYL